ncbi:DUF6797 domain-containing protein [Allorhodopirellula solitaria]|uniref:Auracyanin-A n=1 Tax=Allorhodopirellula solitaria TaxID=2527987 RepID=A0A5C5XU13_9BACT|nr:DUF6797 domain-containing protein [Allorhodopirellula solitaria]TWT66049.1 Auracyanin-A precursor [Allorhodopirellula solitaria]
MKLFLSTLCVLALFAGLTEWVDAAEPTDLLRDENLVAWCIVPFDAAQRSPEERAVMLNELGISRCAYDWREKNVPTFEQEILAYKRHGIEFFAFWSVHDEAFQLFEKHGLHPQIWQTLVEPVGEGNDEKVENAIRNLIPLAKRTEKMGSKLGLYNHGGWGGEPRNLVAVCEGLRQRGYGHVGIVYNFHHGHGHIADWSEVLAMMQPLLHCINLNGMNPSADPKILGIGKGEHELEMIGELVESGYQGPIGILDHRNAIDARDSLSENLEGLRWISKELSAAGSGGEKPPAPKPFIRPAEHPIGRIYPGANAYRDPPITIECLATLNSHRHHNILVANEAKASPDHWELFTMPASGHLTAYLPGSSPDHVRSKINVCDGTEHRLAMVYEVDRVRLYVDGEQVADQAVTRVTPRVDPSQRIADAIGIGRLVRGRIGCDGEIGWVRISSGTESMPQQPVESIDRNERTLGLWILDEADQSIRQPASLSNTVVTSELAPAYDAGQVVKLIQDAEQQGDPVRGSRVFANAKLACLSCHRVGTHGGDVGPELTSIASQVDINEIVESVLWPSRVVKPEYVSWRILTADGDILNGYKCETDEDSLTLKVTTTGELIEIAHDEIEAELPSSTVMPDGLSEAMTRRELIDLVSFLSRLRSEKGVVDSDFDRELSAVARNHSHEPIDFSVDAAPLSPDRWPSHAHEVNRDRIYDFYTKQAEYFRTLSSPPHLVNGFPGLDGGSQGHWGNQNESVWADDRWNATELGRVQAGVLRVAGQTLPRAVCVRLGEQSQIAACFNPDTLTYDAVWEDGFVQFSSVRSGLMGGMRIQGRLIEQANEEASSEPKHYHGYYRYGDRIVFAYRIGETEYLDAPWVTDGHFTREVAPRDQHSMQHVVDGGPSLWPNEIKTDIRSGDQKPYAVDTIELPINNPAGSLMYVGGHDFLSDGSALLCTIQGDVWRVRGLQGDKNGKATWQRFARGLHHPLGLVVSDDEVYVQCRDQLTRLDDLNGDGVADFYECFNNTFETSPAGHDFVCGLERDDEGNFYTASGNQGLLRISADGTRAEILATGLRNPDGLGLLEDGTITVPCSEGDWTPASMICAVEPGSGPTPHFGHGGPIDGAAPQLPLVYLPRGIDNSSGGQERIDSKQFGPLEGKLAHFSFGAGAWFVVLLDNVDGQRQGAVVPMMGEFQSGVHRGRVSPHDGQLYVSGMTGWGTYTPDEGCFERIRYTGDTVQVPLGFHVHANGVRIDFSQPVDSDLAESTSSHFAQVWNYRYSAGYGSPELSTTHPATTGHDVLSIASAHVLEDGRSMFIELPDLQPVNQLHLRLNVNEDESLSCSPSGSGHDLMITVHRMDAPFSDFPGYQPNPEKVIAIHPQLVDLAPQPEPLPNPWRQPIKGAREIEIQTDKNLTFAVTEFAVAPNEPISLTLVNPDVVPHNWVLSRRGALEQVGKLSNHLVADPLALLRNYVPESDAVLAYTDIADPGSSETIHFHAPATPGRYPFLCTFPGHWMVMNGTMVVERRDRH